LGRKKPLKLSIIIPAYNEEEAIATIIERTLAAREHIIQESQVSDVEVIVVNDGSTDKTAEIARRYDDIKLISFDQNRGYGAAIKAGFAAADGDLLSFLDADGTCDPLFFVQLCNALEREGANIAIGSRMGPESKMPVTRVLGNKIYAFMLGVLGNCPITDTASGMRVIRRSSLDEIYPLPDGLEFTPAMSAKAILDENLSIVEVPMPYKERIGESKLRVISDGISFARSIIDTTLLYRPSRILVGLSILLAAVALFYSAYPLEYYLRNTRVEDWMVYRVLTITVLGIISLSLLSTGIISEQIISLTFQRKVQPSFFLGLLFRLFNQKYLVILAITMFLTGVAINLDGLISYLETGRVYMHWSRVVVGGFLAMASFQLIVTAILLRIIGLALQQKLFLDKRKHLKEKYS